MEMDEEQSRRFGQLETKVDTVLSSLTEMREGNALEARNNARGRRRIHKRLDDISGRQAIMANDIERMNDRVDTQGAAITNLEIYKTRQEREDLSTVTKARNNRRWIVAILSSLGVIGGAEINHASDGKIAKAVAEFFK